MSPADSHPAYGPFRAAEGSLLLGGIALPRLAERVGRTPFYAYDRQVMDQAVARLRGALPQQVKLSYAIKANPMPAVVQHMVGLVDGFDVASAAEMRVALDTPVDPSNISFAGPGKTAAELRQAVAAGVLLHVESEREIEALTKAAEDLGLVPRVAIRVNPDFDLRVSGMRMGGGAQQFGADAEIVPRLLDELRDRQLEFVGFHIFAGSQCLSAEAICSTQEAAIRLAAELAQHAPSPVRHLNIGGGFGIPYTAEQEPLDLAPIGDLLHQLCTSTFADELSETRLVIELGRYLVGEAGIYVCRVLDRKVSRQRVFLVTDGGLHHHLAATGNFGQVIRRNYPVAIGNRMSADADSAEEATVVGCLCTPLDLLADRVELPAAQVGDLFVVFQSGAYGKTASPSGFLSHPEALEVLV